jgi:uncharacterized protein (DUF1810 family)
VVWNDPVKLRYTRNAAVGTQSGQPERGMRTFWVLNGRRHRPLFHRCPALFVAPAWKRKHEDPRGNLASKRRRIAGDVGSDSRRGQRDQRGQLQTLPPSMMDDPFDLRSRFVAEQKIVFAGALAEIKAGSKDSHWMWYVIPTPPFVMGGIERGSQMNREYALRDPPPRALEGFQAARAYLDFPEEDGVNLRQNLCDIFVAIAQQLELGKSALSLMGGMDEPKLKSAAKLFECVTRPPAGVGEGDAEVNALCRRILTAMREPLLLPLPIDHPVCQLGARARRSSSRGDGAALGGYTSPLRPAHDADDHVCDHEENEDETDDAAAAPPVDEPGAALGGYTSPLRPAHDADDHVCDHEEDEDETEYAAAASPVDESGVRTLAGSGATSKETSKETETRAKVPRNASRSSDVRQQVQQPEAPITAAILFVTRAICDLFGSVAGGGGAGGGERKQ